MSATEKGLQDHEPRHVEGVRGAKSSPFKKKFKNQKHMEDWLEREGDNHDIHRIYRAESYEEASVPETIDLLRAVADEKPADAREIFNQLLLDRVYDVVQERRAQLAHVLVSGEDPPKFGDPMPGDWADEDESTDEEAEEGAE